MSKGKDKQVWTPVEWHYKFGVTIRRKPHFGGSVFVIKCQGCLMDRDGNFENEDGLSLRASEMSRTIGDSMGKYYFPTLAAAKKAWKEKGGKL